MFNNSFTDDFRVQVINKSNIFLLLFQVVVDTTFKKNIEKIRDEMLAWVILSAITDNFTTNIQIMTGVRH